MTLDEIIAIADEAYPDGLVGRAHQEPGGVGDTLAEFIANELKETYDPDADDTKQLHAALRAMETAEDEVSAVVRAFSRAFDQAAEQKFLAGEEFVDMSTAHITYLDSVLLQAAATGPITQAPVLVWANGQGFGCFVHVQEEPYDDIEYDRSDWPFSAAFWSVMKLLQADGVSYVRFDQDGAIHEGLPRAWEENDG